MMSEKKKSGKPEDRTSEKTTEKQRQNIDTDKDKDPKEDHPSHSARYIRDKKTGKWKIVNPAGSMAYNYLYRDEFPED